jgi:hypothetical protein
MKNPNTDPLDVLDVLSHEVGLGATEIKDKPTASELRDIDELIAFARGELNRQARAEVAPVARISRVVRASILAMTRDAIVTRIAELRRMPGMLLATSHHRYVGHSTEDDLREVLEDLESLLDRTTERGA